MAFLFEVTPLLESGDEKWYVNPLNVTIVRPVKYDTGSTATEIMFVNTVGPQSSIRVKDSMTRIYSQLNDALRD